MPNITVKFNNKTTKEFPKNTTIYEVAHYYQKSVDYDILGAKINNEIVSMNTHLTKNCTIDFIGIADPYGYRMYQAALKFIFEVAAKETFPNIEVHFLHSVPKGIMVEILGHNITKDDILNLKNAMDDIIEDDKKIVKYNVSAKDAITYFETHNQLEKALNIHNMNIDIVRFYKLKKYYNFYYTELPYDTQKINKYDLVYLGKNKIVLVYPSGKTSSNTPKYVHYDNIIDTFETGKKWLKTMHIPYVSDLNALISSSKIKELIEANELVFNEQIANVARIINEKKDIKIILIAGPSSSGKTTTTKRLSSYLNALGYNTIPISVDDYYKEREETPKNEDGEYDFESLNAIDTKMFNKDLNALLKGLEVKLPIYDFISGKKTRSNDPVKMGENSILLVEGLHSLNDELTEDIEPKHKYKIYLSPFIPLSIDRHNYISTVDLRLLRRIVRDNRTRGTNVSETIELWQNVREGEEKYIFPFIHQANIVINTSYVFEIGVLKVFVEPLLYSVGLDSPYYEEARRLIKSLQEFYPIPSEYIGKSSILREFIG